jgi:uncharacterized membrane protein
MRPRLTRFLTGLSTATILRAALGASLALNLVLAGLLLWPDSFRPRGVRGLEARMERVLGPADRGTFRAIMDSNRPRYEARQQALRQARPLVGQAIGAEPFSEERLRAAMAVGREHWRAFSESYEDSLAHATAAISPDGRRRLLADLPENH